MPENKDMFVKIKAHNSFLYLMLNTKNPEILKCSIEMLAFVSSGDGVEEIVLDEGIKKIKKKWDLITNDEITTYHACRIIGYITVVEKNVQDLEHKKFHIALFKILEEHRKHKNINILLRA